VVAIASITIFYRNLEVFHKFTSAVFADFLGFCLNLSNWKSAKRVFIREAN